MKIVCISGKARHGKDTAANYMKKKLELSGKVTHQMEWVGYMNNAKSCAEEVILERVVYSDR